jgi:Na+/melibiose symporter-like transporter
MNITPYLNKRWLFFSLFFAFLVCAVEDFLSITLVYEFSKVFIIQDSFIANYGIFTLLYSIGKIIGCCILINNNIFSRKTTIVGGLHGMFVSFLIGIYALKTQSNILFITSRVLSGVFSSISSIIEAAVIAHSRVSDVKRNLALIEVMYMAASFLNGYALNKAPLDTEGKLMFQFIFASVLCLIAIIFILQKYYNLSSCNKENELFFSQLILDTKNRPFLTMSVILFSFYVGYSIMEDSISLIFQYNLKQPLSFVLRMLNYFSAMAILVSILTQVIFKNTPNVPMMLGSFSSLIASCLIFQLFPSNKTAILLGSYAVCDAVINNSSESRFKNSEYKSMLCALAEMSNHSSKLISAMLFNTILPRNPIHILYYAGFINIITFIAIIFYRKLYVEKTDNNINNQI